MIDKVGPERRDARLARIASGQHGLVTIGQLAAIGMSRQSVSAWIAAGRLHRVQRGVYAVGHAALTPIARRLAAVLTFGELAVASHITAAALWDVRRTSATLHHVTVPGKSQSRSGIRVHRRTLAAEDRDRCDGVPVTSLARTLVDLGDVVPATQVRNAFVRAEHLRLIDMAKIDAALERAGRTRGAAALREVLRVYDARWEHARSDLELALLDLATTHELPEPEVNAWIEDRFCVDALWRDRRVIVEADSSKFHNIPSARRDDARRDSILRARGFTVMRFSYRDITRREGAVVSTLRSVLVPGHHAS
jgi:very-short-patch-repair endonuclease/predicted transcriptional regulator of viral defense system